MSNKKIIFAGLVIVLALAVLVKMELTPSSPSNESPTVPANAEKPILTPAPGDLSTCKKGDGPQATFKTKQELLDKMQKAYTARDEAALMKLASCDFMISVLESDVGSYNNPQNILHPILENTKNLRWRADKMIDYDGQINVPLGEETDLWQHQFIFR